MEKMDLGEAKACLDEYRVWLDSTRGMVKPITAEGELRDALEKRNARLMALLEVYRKEALDLSTMILLEMFAQDDREILGFMDEWEEIFGALGELGVAIDKAEQARAEYLNPDEAKEKGKRDPNEPVIVIRKDS
jgi:hypothetical protein